MAAVVDFNQLIQQGSAHAWLYIPVAILLGALHGLEPGHSKTMMAAFIVAVRGTIRQAVLLGLCAAFSHSLIIWLLAGLALHYGSRWNAKQTEPYFQLVSAALIFGLALWMFVRTRRDLRAAQAHGHAHKHRQAHAHEHEASGGDFQDDHEREHAAEIEQRFAGRPVTTSQIVLFGLTGGLMPCPAAFTVLLVCLQLKRVTLGLAIVIAFGIGLALTMVLTGAIAAWSVHHAQKKFKGFGEIVRRAPYVSCVVLIVLATAMAWHGWQGLHAAVP